jgi:Skp family chaperone for outer membrane proteins
MRYVWLGVLILGAFLTGCGRGRAGVATIDIEEIFKSYTKSKAIYAGLEKERKDLENKGQEMLDEINRLVKESGLLSDEARREREVRIKEKSAALEAYRMGATRDLMEKTSEEYRRLMADVRVAAEAVARRRGLTLILDGSTAAYRAKELEVTNEVVEELNRRCETDKGGSREMNAAPSGS